MKKWWVLVLLCCAIITACCIDDTPEPVWIPPQPVDNLLLGSWIQTWESEIGYTIVTFSENNECVINKYSNGDNASESRNWYVNGNILVLPGDFDHRTKRFPEYSYILEDGKLYFKFIKHPYVGCGPRTSKGDYSPLWIYEEIFTKFEE